MTAIKINSNANSSYATDEQKKIIQEIIQQIEKYDKIILHRHIAPDYDALGSVFGLREIIKERWPDKKVWVAGDASQPFELVPENDKLDDQAWQGALAIVCDSSTVGRTEDQRFLRADKVIKIDHHQDFEPFGDISWVETDMTACAELIVMLYLEGASSHGLKLNAEAAQYLFCGIVTDTNCWNFIAARVAPRVFAYTSLLIEKGLLDPQLLIRMIKTRTAAQHRFASYVGYTYKQPIPEFIYTMVNAEKLREYGLSWEEAHGNANSLMGIQGVKIWALFVEKDDSSGVVCEIRSSGPAINEIAYKHGGGGHRLACGCLARDWQHVDQIITDLQIAASSYQEE